MDGLKEMVTRNSNVDYVYFNEKNEYQLFPAKGYDKKVSRESVLSSKEEAKAKIESLETQLKQVKKH